MSANNKPFAPGVIEHHRRRIGTAAQRRELRTWLLAAAVLGLLVFIAASTGGFFSV
jgi:hypothetical protein